MLQKIKADLQKEGNPDKVAIYQKFFKTGKAFDNVYENKLNLTCKKLNLNFSTQNLLKLGNL